MVLELNVSSGAWINRVRKTCPQCGHLAMIGMATTLIPKSLSLFFQSSLFCVHGPHQPGNAVVEWVRQSAV
jgi:hypothetical protein